MTSVNRNVRVPSADVQIVAVQPAAERQGAFRRQYSLTEGLACAQHLPLHEVHIEIAVVVVVEQPDTRCHDLGLIETAGHAVEVDEVETRRLREVNEPFGVAFRWRALRLRANRDRRCLLRIHQVPTPL